MKFQLFENPSCEYRNGVHLPIINSPTFFFDKPRLAVKLWNMVLLNKKPSELLKRGSF